MVRIILTDDHPSIREGVKKILEKEKNIEVIGCASNGVELMKLLEKMQPDVIVIDINMPEMNGIEATRLIKQKYPSIKIIAFSQYDERRFVKQILKGGANGYLLKSAVGDEFVKAIDMVMNGGIYLSEELPNVFGEKAKPRANYLFPELTEREIDILKLICQEKSTHEIAEILFLSTNTIETHRANLLLKVGSKNTAGLVKWALENEII